MTSRKQINVRLSEDDEVKLAALMERIKLVTGIPVRTVDVYRMAINALEKQYPAEEQAQETTKGRSKRSK